jgi:membrane protein
MVQQILHSRFWQGNSRFHDGLDFLKQLFHRVNDDDCGGLAAEMAYNFMLAFVPLLIFMVSMFGLISTDPQVLQNIMQNMHRIVPGEAVGILETSLLNITSDSSGGIAIIGLIGALWSSSNAAMVVIKALNRAYRCTEDKRPFWKQRLVALGIVLGMAVILILCSNLLVFGGMIIDFINTHFGLSRGTESMLHLLRCTIGFGALLVITDLIYVVWPDYKDGPVWKRTWTGAFTFIGLWIILSWLFSLYVANMGQYSQVYGSLGAIVVLMIWLYLTSFVLLIGGEVNAIRSGCTWEKPGKDSVKP